MSDPPAAASTRTLTPYRIAIGAILTCSFPLSLVGKVIFERTHHRPLGAVTFSLLAFVAVALFTVLALRTLCRPNSTTRVKWVSVLLACGLASCLASLLLLLSGL